MPTTLPRLSLLIVAAVSLGLTLAANNPSAQSADRTAPFSHALPKMDGGHLRAIVVEVNYGPGEADKPHSHPCVVIGYVAQGAIRFQVRGGPETVYKTGESFYEAPNGVHQVSANASDKEPAKLIAYFICDHETPLTVPPAGQHTSHEASSPLRSLFSQGKLGLGTSSLAPNQLLLERLQAAEVRCEDCAHDFPPDTRFVVTTQIQSGLSGPQWLKPSHLGLSFGTTEIVPFPDFLAVMNSARWKRNYCRGA